MAFLQTAAFAQYRPGIKAVLDQLGTTARSYLLSANRPGFSISPYTTEKKSVNFSFSVSYSEDIVDLPLSVSYGISNRTEVFLDIPFYTESYNFEGNKIRGVGDVVTGIRYNFHQSEYFYHSVQTAVKIPTASKNKELGTGKLDFNFGLAQGFIYKKFSYDLSAELNFLRRRDFPNMKINVPLYIKRVIDSMLSVYNYNYEKELALSGGPAYGISERISVYTGLAFIRNFKLDYNILQSYSGAGYFFSDKVSIGVGVSFGIKNSAPWALSLGISIKV